MIVEFCIVRGSKQNPPFLFYHPSGRVVVSPEHDQPAQLGDPYATTTLPEEYGPMVSEDVQREEIGKHAFDRTKPMYLRLTGHTLILRHPESLVND